MSNFPLVVREISIADVILFVVKSGSRVCEFLEVVVVQRVYVVVCQVKQLLDGLAGLVNHPQVVGKHSIVVDPRIFFIFDEGTTVIAHIVMNVVIVENRDGHSRETVR